MMKVALCLFAIVLCAIGCSPDQSNPEGLESDTQKPHSYKWLAAGQSNMSRPEVFESHPNVSMNVKRYDPLIGETPEVPALFGIRLSENLQTSVSIQPRAISGTEISCWQLNGRCFEKNIVDLDGTDFDGVIWWQGEGDAHDETGNLADAYENRLMQLIVDWRDFFKNEKLPFFIVELEQYNGADDLENWKKIRDSQRAVSEKIENVFLIETDDITLPIDDVHPKYAYPFVAQRLANMAFEKVYSK